MDTGEGKAPAGAFRWPHQGRAAAIPEGVLEAVGLWERMWLTLEVGVEEGEADGEEVGVSLGVAVGV